MSDEGARASFSASFSCSAVSVAGLISKLLNILTLMPPLDKVDRESDSKLRLNIFLLSYGELALENFSCRYYSSSSLLVVMADYGDSSEGESGWEEEMEAMQLPNWPTVGIDVDNHSVIRVRLAFLTAPLVCFVLQT